MATRLSFRWSVIIATLALVTFTILKAIVVWGTLSTYGVNPWIFLILDITTIPPYVWGIGKMIQGLRGIDRMRMVYVGGIVAVIAFLAPYAYLYAAGHAAMPLTTKVIIGIIIAVLFGAFPLREVISKSRNR